MKNLYSVNADVDAITSDELQKWRKLHPVASVAESALQVVIINTSYTILATMQFTKAEVTGKRFDTQAIYPRSCVLESAERFGLQVHVALDTTGEYCFILHSSDHIYGSFVTESELHMFLHGMRIGQALDELKLREKIQQVIENDHVI